VHGDGHSQGAPARPGSTRRSRWFNILLAAASVLISLLLLELASRVYFTAVQSYPSLDLVRRHEYDPYRLYRLAPRYKRRGVVHNSQGFRRSTDVSRAKPPGTFRIFLMGGSTAYGMAAAGVFPPRTIANDETIDHYLERFLNERHLGRDFEVINAAVSGYWTHHHLIYLNQELLEYQPDMVIFLDGHNDHYVLSADHRQFSAVVRTGHIQALNEPTLLGVMETALTYAGSKSWLAFGLMSGLDRVRTWNRVAVHRDRLAGDLADYGAVARRTFLKMIKRNVLLLMDEHVIPVVLLQPELALSQRKRFTPEEQQLLKIELSYRQRGYQERLNVVNREAARLLAELAAAYHFMFLDLREVFSGMQEQAYIDYVHLSPAGARHLAHHVGSRIVPLVESPP
jgi:lysophospholipase L1-like esterase